MEIRDLSNHRTNSLWVAMVLLAGAAIIAQTSPAQAPKAERKLNENPLSAESLSVYHALLAGWLHSYKSEINLAIETVPEYSGPAENSTDCDKRLELEPIVDGEFHQFRVEDLPQLSSNTMRLLDSEEQTREIEKNDPAKSGAERDSVPKRTVHRVFYLGEIRYDKSHTHAVLSYQFVCGNLCAYGGTAVVEKVEGVWKMKPPCGFSIS